MQMRRTQSLDLEKADAVSQNIVCRDQKWQRIEDVPGLYLYSPAGTYFGRVRYKGKLIGPKALETQNRSEAEQRLPVYIKEWKAKHDAALAARANSQTGPTTWKAAKAAFIEESENLLKLGVIQKAALQLRIRNADKIEFFWPTIIDTPIRSIPPTEALQFMSDAKTGTGRFMRRERAPGAVLNKAGAFWGGPMSDSTFPPFLWAARKVAEKAAELDAANGLGDFENPFRKVPCVKPASKLPPLPSETQLTLIANVVKSTPKTAVETTFKVAMGIDFLGMSGLRIGELLGGYPEAEDNDEPHPGLLWEDIRDGTTEPYIHVTCEKKRKNENWRRKRKVPFFGGKSGPMAELVKELRAKWYKGNPKAKVFDGITFPDGFNGYLRRACRVLRLCDGHGNPIRMTNQDLRHVFATRCVEANVSWTVLAEWLGHEDGGLLASRTYSHLRTAHSFEMARRLGRKPPA